MPDSGLSKLDIDPLLTVVYACAELLPGRQVYREFQLTRTWLGPWEASENV